MIVADVGPNWVSILDNFELTRVDRATFERFANNEYLLIAKDPIQETPVRNKVIWSLGIAILLSEQSLHCLPGAIGGRVRGAKGGSLRDEQTSPGLILSCKFQGIYRKGLASSITSENVNSRPEPARHRNSS